MTEPRSWSDEELSAFLDGALAPAEASALRTALEEDTVLAARLSDLAAVQAALGEAFNQPLQEQTPPRFQAILDAAFPAPPADNIVALSQRRQEKPKLPTPQRWRTPLAAGLALVIGAVGGAQFTRSDRSHEIAQLEVGVIAPGNPIFSALETRPSAELVKITATDVVRPVLTFKDAQGRVCREFEMASSASMAIGVACRGATAWRLEILLPAADRPSDGQGYVEASGFDSTALDAVLARLGAGAPLDAAEEAAVLKPR
jgi:hypothetical protein